MYDPIVEVCSLFKVLTQIQHKIESPLRKFNDTVFLNEVNLLVSSDVGLLVDAIFEIRHALI